MNMEDQNRKPDTPKDPEREHIARLAAKAHLSLADRIAYDRAVDRYNVNRLVEKGRVQELKEAEEKALERGRNDKRLEIARKFKKDGFPADVIARNTGLSIQEIEQL